MGQFMKVAAAGMRCAFSVGVGRVVCCLMNRAAGGPLTKFWKQPKED